MKIFSMERCIGNLVRQFKNVNKINLNSCRIETYDLAQERKNWNNCLST